MDYYLELGGGLGDIFNSCFRYGGYRGLLDLNENDRATVALITNNPFAWELFEWHPKRHLMDIRQLPYSLPGELDRVRQQQELPFRNPSLTSARPTVEFFPLS